MKGPLAFGLQRKGGELVLPSVTLAEGGSPIDLTVEAVSSLSDEVRFRGPFVHGSAKEQFLYLAWKRLDVQSGEGPLGMEAENQARRTSGAWARATV